MAIYFIEIDGVQSDKHYSTKPPAIAEALQVLSERENVIVHVCSSGDKPKKDKCRVIQEYSGSYERYAKQIVEVFQRQRLSKPRKK